MISTFDGYDLSIGDECLVMLREDDDQYIKELVKCIYKDCHVQDNQPFLDSLSPGCSGAFPPPSQTMHRFEEVNSSGKEFILCDSEVRWLIIKDKSSVEEVTKLKLRV